MNIVNITISQELTTNLYKFTTKLFEQTSAVIQKFINKLFYFHSYYFFWQHLTTLHNKLL